MFIVGHRNTTNANQIQMQGNPALHETLEAATSECKRLAAKDGKHFIIFEAVREVKPLYQVEEIDLRKA